MVLLKVVVLAFFATSLEFAVGQSPELVQYYVDLITEANEGLEHNEFRTSSRSFASSGSREDYGTVDFVVVGAGPGGSIAASRLTEVAGFSVLVLEAGDYPNNLTAIPNMYLPVQFTDYNWAYNSTPQTTSCLGLVNQVCLLPRGQGLGGTTLINGLVYSRAHRHDFTRWAQIAKSIRWGYENVLRLFKKSENFVLRDPNTPFEPAYHGEGGLLRVEQHLPESPQLKVFFQANKEIGYNLVDYNANNIGVSPAQICTINGRREDGYTAFLAPFRRRKNLKILTKSYVTKININKVTKRAEGVNFSHNGKSYRVRARKEVILAAGAFATPQLLLLSGIGPRRHLEEMGIEVVEELEVGSGLGNNPTFYGLTFGSNYTEPIEPLSQYVREYLRGVGPLAAPGNNQGVGFYESQYTNGTGVPDIEIMMIPANATGSQRSFGLTDQTYQDVWADNNVAQTFFLYIIRLHATSSGSVRLKSNDPYDYPVIDTKYLSDIKDEDINVLYEGIQLALRLIDTPAFKSINATLQSKPFRACRQFTPYTKEYWYCAIRQMTIDLYHPMSSCPMGTDPKQGAVVDSSLRVFGIPNLRISDASVFPFTLSGHPMAQTIMVGDQLAEIIKATYVQF